MIFIKAYKMGMYVGNHFKIEKINSPVTYKIRTGNRFLKSLENGEISSLIEETIITICEETGSLMINSPYGNFSYIWTKSGRGGESLHKFLSTLHFDYFMDKTYGGNHKEADIPATLASYKKDVIEDRKRNDISREEAREIMDGLNEISPFSDENHFYSQLYCHDALQSRYFDGAPWIKTREKETLRHFWNEIWTPFARKVLDQYEGQAQAAAMT